MRNRELPPHVYYTIGIIELSERIELSHRAFAVPRVPTSPTKLSCSKGTSRTYTPRLYRPCALPELLRYLRLVRICLHLSPMFMKHLIRPIREWILWRVLLLWIVTLHSCLSRLQTVRYSSWWVTVIPTCPSDWIFTGATLPQKRLPISATTGCDMEVTIPRHQIGNLR